MKKIILTLLFVFSIYSIATAENLTICYTNGSGCIRTSWTISGEYLLLDATVTEGSFFFCLLDITIVQDGQQIAVTSYITEYNNECLMSCTGIQVCCDEVMNGVSFTGKLGHFPSWFDIHSPFILYYGNLSIGFNGAHTTTTVPPSSCAAETIYGENSEETELLRRYRDSVLSKTPEGQEIIKTYYKYSPTMTKLLEQVPLLKKRAKMVIDSMLPEIRKKVEETNEWP